ncbi:nuclear pore complex protein Nup85 [Coccinella septempunctata]|uniref:nuclear pore complex protein Nup85 n=1 Tax=Coccinella septempunctata TaxID=41139 RepID=UPI001D07D71C|nr:nuclear pore complex protein Nup85 [Coccinella septempunctata]
MNETQIIIPSKLCQRAGISLAWKPFNDLGIFAYERKHSGAPDKPSQHYPTSEVSVFHLRQEVTLFRPVLRKLVNESNGTFLDLQSVVSSKAFNAHEDLLNFSRQYRSIIRACLENLQEDILKAGTSCERDEIQNLITIFYSVECIWHLCEILFIDATPGNVVLPHLLDWVRFHFPKYERNAAEMLCDAGNSLEMKVEYWPTVIGSLLQGRIKVARGLLKQHSASDTKSFMIADQCLKTMPLYDVYSGLSAQEFHLQRQHWKVDVQSKIEAKVFSNNKNLELIMGIIVKNDLAWSEIKNYYDTWYELLPAWLFYSDPTVKSYELGNYAKLCINEMGKENKLRHIDKVLLAAMRYDQLEVIKEIQDMCENGWFATHLINILYHSGQLSKIEKEVDKFSGKAVQESFILNYGTMLMSHKSLWQVGLSYLDHCSETGLHAIQLLLPRLPLETELKCHKIIREAQKRGLSHIVHLLCKIQGMKNVKMGRLGTALTWALKSQDSTFVSLLADKFLREYAENGKLKNTDLLFNLGPSMLASDRLIFLGKYYEFHKLYQERQFKEAGNLLIKLLESKIIPKYFWYILLLEAIPLLESEEIIFSSNDTYMIINFLEGNIMDEKLKTKLNVLRLATARNLSRAILFEAQG